MKGFQKAGRKPKGWKPPYSKSLQVKKEKIVITFDDNNKGDLKDLMMKVKDSPQEDQVKD
tara:strand:- start:552 stop:731 length:180 start_codon:yes stop_codon:yes gene_type:complete